VDEVRSWSVSIKTKDGEQTIVLEVDTPTLWLDAEHARDLATALDRNADELEGLSPRG